MGIVDWMLLIQHYVSWLYECITLSKMLDKWIVKADVSGGKDITLVS